MRAFIRTIVLGAMYLVPGGTAVSAEIRSTLVDAQEQFEQGHHEQALKLYKQADEAEPGHAAVAYNIGLCHLNLGDAEKAMQQFERVASQAGVSRRLRRDAFYNIGLVRASGARERLNGLLAPASRPADQVPPDAPANIEKLQQIADDLLRAIAALKESKAIEPGDETEHNIRAARITRRNVLGLLRQAMEEKEKQDMLDDPRAYLEALIFEQYRQVGLTRYLVLNPPAEPARSRAARRAAVRLQRKIMERTAMLADNLAQFREVTEESPTPPATQPADKTPRETIYHAAAGQLDKAAIVSQRDACAFLLDGEVNEAHDKQFTALDEMHAALYLFPLNPAQTLVKARTGQAQLKELVETIESDKDWLRDPLLAEATIPDDAEWEPDKTAIHYRQLQISNVLALLHLQCQYIAAMSQPANEPAPASEQENPLLDPELNARLAEVLAGADELREPCLSAIAAKDKDAALAAQAKMLEIIDAALELLPKTIEQRIAELIVRQARLNEEVKAEVGEANPDAGNESVSPLQKIRKWAARLKSKLFDTPAGEGARMLRGQQEDIQSETTGVNDEIRQQIPSGTTTQPGASPPPAGTQSPQVQAYIEASKHLADADTEMGAAIRGFDKAVVENSSRPMRADGPVQTAQTRALEELVRALAALQPPENQPQENGQDQQDRQQQQRQDNQDVQREVDRLDRERERAMQELYQKRPRTVIKDW